MALRIRASAVGDPVRPVRIMKRGGRKGRGFHQYGQPFRCSYGTEIEVYESSAARGPHCWLNLTQGPHLTFRSGNGTAHLNAEQARALVARLQAWLDEIPKRWA